jgi:ABC-type multidrug transport system ATPase subunit
MLAGLAEGRLVILSTHIVSDVESVAGRLILLREGRILADTTPAELIASARGRVWSVTTDAPMASRLQAQNQVSGMVASDGEVTTRIVGDTSPAPSAVPVEPTLEDAYLYAVNR